MPHLWLTPVIAASPWTLGAERTAVEPGEEWDHFRRKLHVVHPRLLPFFKARLMTADEGDNGTACGGQDSLEDVLIGPEPIIFDGASMSISHCGEAFLQRLLVPKEALTLLETAAAAEGWTIAERRWLEEMGRLFAQGFSVVLLG